MNNKQSFQFPAAIRGYHYYRKFWLPIEHQILTCHHELDNPFDMFAIKACGNNGTTVGHLPREISRVTKYILDRGATVKQNSPAQTTVDHRLSKEG